MELNDAFGHTTVLHFSRFSAIPDRAVAVPKFIPPKGATFLGESVRP